MTELEGLVILIVDDDEMFRDVIVDAFKRISCTVITADGANSAQAIIAAKKIDIVISDMNMPNGDGNQLLGRVSDFNVNQPLIILMSGFSELTEEKAIEMGATGLIYKPFNRHQLIEKIKLVWQQNTKQ